VTRQFTALRQRIIEPVGPLGQPRMVVDPNFDITVHVTRFALPSPGSWTQLMHHIRRESMTDLDRDRPLWRASLVEGLEGGRAALLLVAHHAIADGQGAVMLIAGMAGFSPEDSMSVDEPMPPAPEPGRVDVASVTAAALGSSAKRALRTARNVTSRLPDLVADIASDPEAKYRSAARLVESLATSGPLTATQPMSPLMVGRSGTYTYRTLDLPFDQVRAAAKSRGGKLNDTFLAGITGGLRIYHEKHDMPLGYVRVNVPVSTRTASDDASTNAVMIARVELNAAQTDPAKRMAEANEKVAEARKDPLMAMADVIGDISRLVPVSLIAAIARGADITGSNVPGFPIPIYMGGVKVLRMYPVVGNLGAAANVTLLSYAGEICSLGISTDDAAIADGEAFVSCLAEGFEELGVRTPMHAYDPLKAEK
jgi:diacylglycerol O-acyltransferase